MASGNAEARVEVRPEQESESRAKEPRALGVSPWKSFFFEVSSWVLE